MLRGELSWSMGVAWTPIQGGIAEVDGVPRTVMRAFSRRRADIEAAMAERGTSGPHAPEAAALAGCQSKDRATSSETLERAWRAPARELGFDGERVRGLTGRATAASVGRTELDRIFGELIEPDGLTHRRPTFTWRDVIQALCERLPAEAAVDAQRLERAADELLASEQIVPLV